MIRWSGIAASFLFFSCTMAAFGQQKAKKDSSPTAEHCDLIVRVLPEQRRIEATAAVQLPAASMPRDTLSFALRSDLEISRAEVLTPESSGGTAEVHLVSAGKEPGASSRWEIR